MVDVNAGRRHQILRSLEGCVIGQFLGEPGDRRCAWAKAFSTGLLPREFVSPGMCVGGVAERYAKGWHSGCRSRPRVAARPAPAEARQELVCGCGSGASRLCIAMPWLGEA
jgi:hypothetical protein